MNVRVVDAQGQLLEQGRDLGALVQRYRADTRQSISADREESPAREGLMRWDVGELPREWRFRQAGTDIVAFPALVDRGETVAVELWDYPGEASVQHRLGVLRLLRLSGVQNVKFLRKQLLRGNEFNLVLAGGRFDRNALVEDLIDAAYSQEMELDKELPYSEEDFHRIEKSIRGQIIGRANDIEAMLFNVLKQLAALRQKLAVLDAEKWPDTREDIAAQLAFLLGASFLRDTPAEWLAQYPRYLKALLSRVERLAGQYPKDQKYTQSLTLLAQPLQDALLDRPNLLLLSEQARAYRWMLEEFRVSLFAQNLGTRLAVSQKRLAGQWTAVDQWLNENPH